MPTVKHVIGQTGLRPLGLTRAGVLIPSFPQSWGGEIMCLPCWQALYRQSRDLGVASQTPAGSSSTCRICPLCVPYEVTIANGNLRHEEAEDLLEGLRSMVCVLINVGGCISGRR